MFPRAFSTVLCTAFLIAGSQTHGNPPTSLSAYFSGDALKESLIALTPDREKSVRRLDRTLDETRRFVRLQVVSLQAGGALVAVTSYSSEELQADSPTPIDHPFFVYGLPEKLGTGASWEGRVYPAGKFRYKAADKTDKSVNALAVTKEWAIRAMENAESAASE